MTNDEIVMATNKIISEMDKLAVIFFLSNRRDKESPNSIDNKQMDAISDKYNELLMAVENKYPGESRHETALRYIKSCQHNSGEGCQKQHH